MHVSASIAATLLCAAVIPASAQVRYTARSEQQDSARAVPLAPIIVTASQVPVRADRVGFAVTVLDRAALDARRPRTAAEALRSIGGAFIDEAAGPGGPTIVRLRGGEEVFTQILVDGVRVNQNGGFFDFQGLTLGNIDRIEIARGPQSALHGSSAVSGAIQFLTRVGQPGAPRVDVSAEGSESTEHGGGYRTTANVSGGSESLRYSGGLGWTWDRGIFELPHDTKTAEASLRVDAAASPMLDLSGTFRFAGVDAMLPVRDPGATRVPLDPNARSERDRIISSVVARINPRGRVQHAVRASLYREAFVYDDLRDDVAAEIGNDPFVFDATFRLDSRLLRSGLEYSGTLRGNGDAGYALTWGALWEREDLEDRTSGEFPPGHQQLDRDNTAAFGELLVTPVHWLDLIAGARIEAYEGLSSSFTPRASAVVDLTPLFDDAPGRVLALRLGAGRAFKAPNLQEQYLDNPFILSNPDLEPETSTSWEAGLALRPRSGVFDATITWFQQRFEDLIRSVAVGDDGQQQNRNLGASRARGIEWQLAVRPSGTITVGTDGAWLRTRILDNSGLSSESFPEGEPLPFRPTIVASAFLETSLSPSVRANLRATHVGSQLVLTERFAGNRVELDAYTLAGVSINWDVRQGWTAYARFDNLFDAQYETAFDRRGIPATGAIGLQWHN